MHTLLLLFQAFKKNVKGVNGGGDFDQEMLDEMYSAIKQEEIVMPAEQTGIVKENYLWKVLLKRGSSPEGRFLHVATGAFDRDLFSLVWGPTAAALSFVFDKSAQEVIVQKATSGFRKCAMISAHYAMSDVFDNLVISLCKFTTLLSSPEVSVPLRAANEMRNTTPREWLCMCDVTLSDDRANQRYFRLQLKGEAGGSHSVRSCAPSWRHSARRLAQPARLSRSTLQSATPSGSAHSC